MSLANLSDDAKAAVKAYAGIAGQCYTHSMKLHGIDWETRLEVKQTAEDLMHKRVLQIIKGEG